MELKQPMTFEEQILQLEKHGLIVNDKDFAKEFLARVNYYRFTGYALQFRKHPNQSDYMDGTTFECIVQLYEFDESLRDLFRRYIEKVELYCRTQIAYGFAIAKCLPAPHDQHYDENNFYYKKGYHEVMENFKREKKYYKDSLVVKHHKNNYNSKMPLWVIVELMSFSNLSKLYSSMYDSEKKIISKAVGVSKDTLQNHLHCLSILRNKCAHGARLYNTVLNPPARFNKSFLRKHTQIKNNSLFAYTFILLKRLPDENSKKALIADIKLLIERYHSDMNMDLVGFPDDYLNILNNSIR